MPETELLLTTNDAAARLGVPKRTMEDWRLDGIGPRYVRVGRRSVRYRPDDLLAYVESLPAGGPHEAIAG